jgi:hypothetical protein
MHILMVWSDRLQPDVRQLHPAPLLQNYVTGVATYEISITWNLLL